MKLISCKAIENKKNSVGSIYMLCIKGLMLVNTLTLVNTSCLFFVHVHSALTNVNKKLCTRIVT